MLVGKLQEKIFYAQKATIEIAALILIIKGIYTDYIYSLCIMNLVPTAWPWDMPIMF